MKQVIIGYQKDERNDGVAELECGHKQHIRHNSPWMNRLWVTIEEGRESRIGYLPDCKKCDCNEPKDFDI